MPLQTKALNNKTDYAGIIIRGLPGSGKTTLGNQIITLLRSKNIPAFQINADQIRSGLNSDLGFDMDDRLENARRLGCLTKLVRTQGLLPVVDFVMPTQETYSEFILGVGDKNFYLCSINPPPDFQSRFQDTNKIFEPASWWKHVVHPRLIDLDPYSESNVLQIAQNILNQHADL